jgi:hypothetical protein
MMNEVFFVTAFISVGVLLLLFLALREVNTWYWKINERIRLQNETNELLRKIIRQHQSEETPGSL